MKIDIQIKDVRKYAVVAFFVDKDDFLDDITKVREEIGLSNVPYTFPIYPQEEANRLVSFYKKGLINLNGTRELLEEFCSKNAVQNLYALDKVLGSAVIFANSLTRKYEKDRLYQPVVLSAILAANIQEDDFLSTQMLSINHEVIQDVFSRFNKDEELVTISVNRESTLKEVRSVFDFIQKYYFKTKKTKDDDGLNKVYQNKYSEKLKDTIPNIKRDRNWYWLHKNGWSYQKIKDHYLRENKTRISLRGIELAIKRYSDNLK